MTGLWKEWKAESRLPTLSTSPLGNLANSRRDSHIPTAPTTKADGKVENQEQVSHFPTATISPISKKKNQSAGGLRLPRRRPALCAA
jgi:hypothetical protein